MPLLKNSFPVPVLYVNRYLWHSFKSIDSTLASQYDVVPFFPLADSRGGDSGWENKPYVVYDQIMKFRSTPLFVRHKAQAYYYVRGKADDVIGWSNAITHILDRQDNAGVDINNYLAQYEPDAGLYFHNFKVFQIDMAREERMDLSVRQQYTSSMIVEMGYHLTKNLGFD